MNPVSTVAHAPIPETSRPLLEVHQVSKRFGATQALSSVSLSILPGSSTALLGRNGAGKSTLISIIAGITQPDTGEILFPGDEAKPSSRTGRATSAVGCVYQHSMLNPYATAAENIALGSFPRGATGLIDWRRVAQQGSDLLGEWGYAHIADRLVSDLEPVERKVVEICKVLAQDCRVLLLDEPTAGLDQAGAKILFERIRAARARGVGILYVSHHLDEIFDVCDTAVILRDGVTVMDRDLAGLGVTDLVDAMVGDKKSGTVRREITSVAEGPVVLEVQGLADADRVVDASFTVRRGECVGLAGLDGAGHMNVGEVIAGLRVPTQGTLKIKNRSLPVGDVKRSIGAGIGFTPEDRRAGGYVPAMSVSENATMTIWHRLRRFGILLSGRRRDKVYQQLAQAWSIKAASPSQPIEQLSGGNQQKVVLARALSSDPDLLVLMNPTAGVDVGAKASIYESVAALASAGKAVLIVSSEDSDFAICDRVLVMYRGELVSELQGPVDELTLSNAIQGE